MPSQNFDAYLKGLLKSNKNPVFIVNNHYYGGEYSEENSEAYIDAESDEVGIPYSSNGGATSRDYDRYKHARVKDELLSIQVQNLIDWVGDNCKYSYKSIYDAGIFKDQLMIRIVNPNLLTKVQDKEFMENFSEQIKTKVGLDKLCLVNMNGEVLWSGNCITKDTPFEHNMFKYLPVAHTNNLGEDMDESPANIEKAWFESMSGKKITLSTLLESIPKELQDASIPALLAIETLKQATGDWYYNQFNYTDLSAEDLSAMGQELYNQSTTIIQDLSENHQ